MCVVAQSLIGCCRLSGFLGEGSLCMNFPRISGGTVQATFGQKDQVTIKFVQDLERLQRNQNKK
jgi:hypothetical protein